MPTYDYRCEGCGHKLAVFQSITAERLTECPKCGEEQLRRLIGSGAGIIFKGSGFYETDYKRARPSSKSSSRSSSEESKPAEKKSDDSSKSTKKSDD